MTLPGFNAENSLSSSSSRYWMLGTSPAGRAEVTPQFCYTNPGSGYTTCCYCYDGYCDCHVLRRHVLM